MTLLTTGVPGLDQVLGGGLAPGSATVLAGSSGTGKTTLAQQICFANATEERRAVYYTTLSEPHAKLIRHLEPFGFFVPEMLGSQVEFLHLSDLIRHDLSGRLEPLFTEVLRKAMDERPRLVVIDSARALRDFTDARQMHLALYDLTSRLAHTDVALLLLGEYAPDELGKGAEFSIADNIIQLANEPREPVDRRWLRAMKVRGAKHLGGNHALRIGAGGCEIFPRIESFDFGEPEQVTHRIASGIPGLDELMGGGIGRGETTFILGPSGISKTIFGLQFVAEGITQRERCLYVTFQDIPEQLTKTASEFGWDLQGAVAGGQLVMHHVPPDQLDLDVLASRIRTLLAEGGIGRVVIDSLAEMAYAARESERFPAYARSLIGLIRNAGATLVITSETTVLGPTAEPAGAIMFLFHNVILLRYIELSASTGRALNIVKMRNSQHSKRLHRFEVGENGLVVEEVLDKATGVLGWTVLRSATDEASESDPAGR